MRRFLLLLFIWLCLASQSLHAGLHYSGERLAEFPCQWRGFLNDLRTLRNVAARPTGGTPLSPLREPYEAEAKRLRNLAAMRALTADELADLGALLIRLGEIDAALEVLRAAQRSHPKHYAIASNLGTAWQLYGDLDQAAEALRDAIAIAPEKFRRTEELQLQLVQLRRRQGKDNQKLDDLFGVRYVGPKGQFEPGTLAAEEAGKLPPDAVSQVQRLLLVLPADARLLWQLGELANAHGDVRIASEIFESCVAQFGLNDAGLRERRLLARAAAADSARNERIGQEAAKTEHAGHVGRFNPRSRRPLLVKPLDLAHLPPINRVGTNQIPWALLLETQVDRNYRPTFPRYLKELDGLEVSLSGFMQPITEDLDLGALMLIEYPTGCWYCEMPEVSGIVLVELPDGKTVPFTRSLVKVTGKLSLNASDPENFLYTIKEARVVEAD